MKIQLPKIPQKTYPRLTASQLVSVQPMSGPSGLINSIRYRYARAEEWQVAMINVLKGYLDIRLRDIIKNMEADNACLRIETEHVKIQIISFTDKISVGTAIEWADIPIADPDWLSSIAEHVVYYHERGKEKCGQSSPGSA